MILKSIVTMAAQRENSAMRPFSAVYVLSLSQFTQIFLVWTWRTCSANTCPRYKKLCVASKYSITNVSLLNEPFLELNKLHIHYCRFPDVELTTFLKISGGKLEEVDICWPEGSASGWTALMHALRTACRNVQKIYLRARAAQRFVGLGTYLKRRRKCC